MRNVVFTLCLGAIACGSGSTKLSTSSADTGAEGGSDGGAEGGAEGGADGGSSDGAADGGTTEPAPDWSQFSGQRVFSVDAYGESFDCEADAVPEEGAAITDGTNYREASALCPSCELIYEVRPGADAACDRWVPLANPSVRMLDLDEGAAKVYSMSESRGEYSLVVLDEDAEYDGFNLSFGYTVDWSYGSTLTVEGQMAFPELPRG